MLYGILEVVGSLFRNVLLFAVLILAFSIEAKVPDYRTYYNDPDVSYRCEITARQLAPGYSERVIRRKMADFSTLTKKVLTLMQDPYVPAHLKRLLASFFDRDDTAIVPLTDEIRQILQMPPNLKSQWMRSGKFVGRLRLVDFNGYPSTENAAAAQRERGNPIFDIATDAVVVQEGSRTNDLIFLLHEISHVRFFIFFEKHLPQLAKRFPEQIRRDVGVDGKEVFYVNQQFFDFLTERYAKETEWATLKATYGVKDTRGNPIYLGGWPSRHDLPIDEDGNEVTEQRRLQGYASDVIRHYRITDPSVLKYRYRSLREMLINGSSPAEVDALQNGWGTKFLSWLGSWMPH